MGVSKKKYDDGIAQVIFRTIVSDTTTPVSVLMKLENHSNSFLLESVEGGVTKGRYSIIGLKPDLFWKSSGNIAYVKEDNATVYKRDKFNTLESLQNILNISKIDLPDTLPRMSAGVFGYIGYDNIRLIEKIPEINKDKSTYPDSLLMRPSVIMVFDNLKDEISIVATIRNKINKDFDAIVNEANTNIDEVLELINKPHSDNKFLVKQEKVDILSNTSKDDYINMVNKAIEYIYAGDIFQVVLSQQFSADFELPAFELYRSLRRINPSPFLFYLNFDDFSVIGSSPEILIRLIDDEITVRPIAGTRPRGKNETEDKKNAKELINDPKELAEHLMLLDLGRNDVGKVSKKGSVSVTDKFFIEYYSHVMHIVSNVIGKINPDKNVIDVLKAGFPAGTVSGAPKIRAMEIIEELEKQKRSIYAGCVGYFSANGDMDTCITLRTAILRENRMYVQAGAGIVADSNPISEYNECHSKAQALFNAAQDAIEKNNSKENKSE